MFTNCSPFAAVQQGLGRYGDGCVALRSIGTFRRLPRRWTFSANQTWRSCWCTWTSRRASVQRRGPTIMSSVAIASFGTWKKSATNGVAAKRSCGMSCYNFKIGSKPSKSRQINLCEQIKRCCSPRSVKERDFSSKKLHSGPNYWNSRV